MLTTILLFYDIFNVSQGDTTRVSIPNACTAPVAGFLTLLLMTQS